MLSYLVKGFPHSEQSAIISTLQSPSVRCCLHSVRRSSEEITGYVAFYFEEEEEEKEEEEEGQSSLRRIEYILVVSSCMEVID